MRHNRNQRSISRRTHGRYCLTVHSQITYRITKLHPTDNDTSNIGQNIPKNRQRRLDNTHIIETNSENTNTGMQSICSKKDWEIYIFVRIVSVVNSSFDKGCLVLPPGTPSETNSPIPEKVTETKAVEWQPRLRPRNHLNGMMKTLD